MIQNDPIKHVVVLMMENHSFDQVFGWTKSIYPQIEGVDVANLRSNSDYPNTGNMVSQNATLKMTMDPDPKHENVAVLSQIENNCGGFVSNFGRTYPQSTAEQRAQIMSYYPKGSLPVIHTLAENYMICDPPAGTPPGRPVRGAMLPDSFSNLAVGK